MTETRLAISGLMKAFGALTVTQDVSLTLETGEIHALIGPNGAGKSTLIGQIAGFITPDAGRIEIAGRDMTEARPAARARAGLGRTFQVSQLAEPLSARRNVMLALQGAQGRTYRFWGAVTQDSELRDAADAALARTGVADRAGVAVSDLSHGERRRVELACALALGPKLLLLDEPLAGLGPEGSAEMVALLDTLRTEVPLLLVEHDMDAVFRLADRISVLVSGAIIASGDADTVRADPRVRDAYLGDGDA
ncbi:ABC transporter ATP-binding protein [Oceanomicrobium pacificus]|uniref:ATP-binding cassette domain-containing protein n=1 Tax=Oceanomicrobium pacificus TaxID=2692916 RepID=A0A6B0THI0_9RHOB|nr:ATP-binding cassette domain-containing protein [Oceanomicrobium pacificus]MXU63867.1 ATP-binding cassette domain-containing protein [Oceanomicrobium pacificus]